MTLLDVRRITNHWKRHPPLRVLVAACAKALGVEFPEPQDERRKKYLTGEDFGRLVAAFNAQKEGGGIKLQGPGPR